MVPTLRRDWYIKVCDINSHQRKAELAQVQVAKTNFIQDYCHKRGPGTEQASVLNTLGISGDLKSRNMEPMDYNNLGEFWLHQPRRILAEGRPTRTDT